LGCDIDPSFERGRCRRLLVRAEAAGAFVVAGENIVIVAEKGETGLS
jgi:hypothetical protein